MGWILCLIYSFAYAVGGNWMHLVASVAFGFIGVIECKK